VIVPFRDEIAVFHWRFLFLLLAPSREPRLAVNRPGLKSLRRLSPGIPPVTDPDPPQASPAMIADNQLAGTAMNQS
jgi:hypothetical protein